MFQLHKRALPLLVLLQACVDMSPPALQNPLDPNIVLPPLKVAVADGSLQASWDLRTVDQTLIAKGHLALFRQVALKQCDPEGQTLTSCGLPELISQIPTASVLTGPALDTSLSVPGGPRQLTYTLELVDDVGQEHPVTQQASYGGEEDLDGDGITTGDCDDHDPKTGRCGSNASCVHAGGKWHCACDPTFVGDGVTCSCPQGETNCGAVCAKLASDASHCGDCSTACATGASCKASMCVCPNEGLVCSGQCVASATDPNNCGACGNQCGDQASCVAGRCLTTIWTAAAVYGGSPGAHSLVLDQQNVYWLVPGDYQQG